MNNRRKPYTLAICFLLILIVGSIWHAMGQPQAKIEVITQGRVSRPYRAPVWVASNNRLFLLWRRPAINKEPLLNYGSFYSIPFDYALKTTGGWELSSTPLEVHIGEQTALDYSGTIKGETASLFVYQRFYDTRFGFDACVTQLQADNKNKLSVLPKPFAILPFATRDPEYLKWLNAYVKEMREIAAERGKKAVFYGDKEAAKTIVPGDIVIDPEDIAIKQDFSRFSATRTEKGAIWLTGIDTQLADIEPPQKYLWAIKSDDQGKTWGARNVIARGNFPQIIAPPKELQIYFTDVEQFGWQGQWPEDNGRQPMSGGYDWPGRGPLMMIRSKDDGKTWSAPQKIVDDKQIIQCRACVAPDGKVWLVYVQSDPDPGSSKRASLWLISSKDNGSTWSKPSQLTDGKYLDREPDIIYRDGKLLIAFSRAGRGITTNIFTAEIDVK